MKTRLRRRQHNLKSKAQRCQGCDGFSLIELMIAMVIATLMLTAVYTVYASLSKSYTTQNVSAEVQQNVRAAIDLMAEDIMMAGLDPNALAGASFVNATTTNLQFTMDRNLNDVIDNVDEERVTYSWDGTDLRQCLYQGQGAGVEDWQNLIDNVSAFSLTYLNSAGNPIASPVSATDLGKIRSVVIDITVREPAGRDGMIQRTYTTTIRCRNIGI